MKESYKYKMRLKRQIKKPIEVIAKVSNEKLTQKSTKKLIEESDKEPIKVIKRVSNDESNKEFAKNMLKY